MGLSRVSGLHRGVMRGSMRPVATAAGVSRPSHLAARLSSLRAGARRRPLLLRVPVSYTHLRAHETSAHL
eukprot:622499-Alexandrium_andersonii.AAC.1